MSLYNMMNGTTPATFLILPMLGKHPDEYPRFRDCFTSDGEHKEYDGHIHVYTRTGGGNREGYNKEILEMESHPCYVDNFDDSFDCTFSTWVFSVPEAFKDDFEKVVSGRIKEVSDKYKKQLYAVYPKLKDKFEQLFN